MIRIMSNYLFNARFDNYFLRNQLSMEANANGCVKLCMTRLCFLETGLESTMRLDYGYSVMKVYWRS